MFSLLPPLNFHTSSFLHKTLLGVFVVTHTHKERKKMCRSNVKENHLAERQVHVLNQWTDKHFQVIQFEADYKLLLGFYNLQYALILVILGMSKMGLSDILIIWIIIIKFHHGLYCLNLIFKILPSDIITKKHPSPK